MRACGIALALLMGAPALAQPAGLQANSGRDCATCHLPWIESFRNPNAILLMDRPPELAVSDSDMCLGCHDGSVGDSRRRVWMEHGHRTGVEPRRGMKVPEILPLKDGKIACRTCHTAHSGAGPETLATTVFVRVRNDQSQLCQMCHPQYAKGPEVGTHPVGGMPWPVPEKLVAAGAKRGPDAQRLICQTCHTPHGSRQESLLVMGTQSSQLCLTCHTQLRPGMWRPDVGREHPQNPPLSSDPMRRAIRDLGTKTGPGETLICLSCHKLHHGEAGRSMLADTLQDSHLCLRCHPNRSEMVGARHDLRVSAPAERNRLGQTPADSGPCGACHSFHQFARRPDPQKLDPTGLCATCHQAGQCAEKKIGLPFSHPSDIHPNDLPASLKLTLYSPADQQQMRSLACLTCHDPHQASQAHFLRSKPDAICSACHGEKVAEFARPHDFTGKQLTNARGRTADETGRCGFCHGIHNAPGPLLWVATKEAPSSPNVLCTACHRADGMASGKAGAELRHPSGPVTSEAAQRMAGGLPLFDAHARQAKEGFVACSTCHEPHGGRGVQAQLLRTGTGGSAQAVCVQCHTETRSLADSLHSEPILRTYLTSTDPSVFLTACGPCHSTHAREGMPATGMWAGPVGGQAYPADQQRCMGCHGLAGSAPRITPIEHPAVVMRNVSGPGEKGFMPLADEKDVLGIEGRVTCETCHLAHGRVLPGVSGDRGPHTIEELRSLRPMVRAYDAPNLCTACHGADGLRRFLYYHQPSKRGVQANEGQP